jgi:uncharacterized lipoprotein YajG
MKRHISKIIGLFAVLTLAACTFTPHEVAMTAQAPMLTSGVGDGVVVGLRVIDDRDSKTVGQRGAGMAGADISASGLVSHVERQSRDVLRNKGFTIADYNDSSSNVKLTVSVRSFKFFIETCFFTGANNVSVAIKAEARKGMQDYQNTYSFDDEARMLVVPDGSGIDEMLNAALLDVLTQFAADSELSEFLAR